MAREEVLRQIAEITQFVRDKAEAEKQAPLAPPEARSGESTETKEMIEKLTGQVTALLEQNKSDKPYANSPVTVEEEETVRGLMGGRFQAPYQRMLGISPNHEMVRGTNEAEDLKRLQDLHDVTCWRYQGLKARGDMTSAVDQLSRHIETRMWAKELQRHGYIKDVATFLNPKSGQLMEVAMTRNNEVLSPQNVTQGMNNLTFTLTSAQLIDQVYVDLVIAANVTRIPLTRSSQKFPRLTGLTQGVWGGVASPDEIPAQGGSNQVPSAIALMPADANFQKPSIQSIQFDAEHVLSFLLFNDDQLEDSIIPWVPFMRNELSKNIARAWDDAIYNGDSVSNQDGVALPSVRRMVNGIRYMCGAQTGTGWIGSTASYTSGNMVNAGAVTITLAIIESAIMKLGKYGLNPRECVFAVRPADYLRIMMLPEFRSFTNAGTSMSLRNGVVGAIYGIDVVPTDIIPVLNEFGALNAGPGQNGTDNKGSAMIWRRDQCLLGMLDTVAVESTRWAPRLITIMQADVRGDFQTIVGQTSDATSGWPYVNILNLTL